MRFPRILSAILPFVGDGGLIAVAQAQLLSSTEPQIPPKYPIGHVDEPFAKPSGRMFEVNRTVGYLTGTNAFYLNRLMKNEDVMMALHQIKQTGYTIIRVWGFGDIAEYPNPKASAEDPERVWFHYINSTGGYINYGADGLERFDFLVSKCEELGLKLVLPMVNNWAEYGGVGLYTGVYADDSALWYEVPRAQEVYRDYVRVIVERYKASPAVFAWQLGNEPRCPGCDFSVVIDWAKNTSAYIKDLDPDHMVCLGDEGWLTPRETEQGMGDDGHGYSGINGVDWVETLKIDTLDYGTIHLWPHHWAYEYEWGPQWIQDHDKLAAEFGKPIILEEYGAAAPGRHIEPMLPWQDVLLKSGFAADQTWQFIPDNTSVKVWPGSEFGINYGTEEWEVLALNHTRRANEMNANSKGSKPAENEDDDQKHEGENDDGEDTEGERANFWGLLEGGLLRLPRPKALLQR